MTWTLLFGLALPVAGNAQLGEIAAVNAAIRDIFERIEKLEAGNPQMEQLRKQLEVLEADFKKLSDTQGKRVYRLTATCQPTGEIRTEHEPRTFPMESCNVKIAVESGPAEQIVYVDAVEKVSVVLVPELIAGFGPNKKSMGPGTHRGGVLGCKEKTLNVRFSDRSFDKHVSSQTCSGENNMVAPVDVTLLVERW